MEVVIHIYNGITPLDAIGPYEVLSRMPDAFSLHEAKTSPGGVIVATFKRAGEVETGSFKK